MKLTKAQSNLLKNLEIKAELKPLIKKYTKALIKELLTFLIILEDDDYLKYQLDTGRNDRINILKEFCDLGIAETVDIETTDYTDYYPEDETWYFFILKK